MSRFLLRVLLFILNDMADKLKIDTMYLMRFAHFKDDPDFDLALTAAIVIKSMFGSSTIPYYTIARLQETLNVSNARAKKIDKALINCGFAYKRTRGKVVDLIINRLYTPNRSSVYIYMEKTDNGVFLYNKAPGVTYNFENFKRQTFEEKMRVVRGLAACYKLHYYNLYKLTDSCNVCDKPKQITLTVAELLRTTGPKFSFERMWASFGLKMGKITLDSEWTVNMEVKDDKVKAEGQENTVPVAVSYITSHFFNNSYSYNTIRRTLDDAVNSGCVRKYNNDRILIYRINDTSYDMHENPFTSYKFNKEGKPTTKFFRINWREKKINGDLKKSGNAKEYIVTEAYKQPGENSYSILACGIIDGFKKQAIRDAFAAGSL